MDTNASGGGGTIVVPYSRQIDVLECCKVSLSVARVVTILVECAGNLKVCVHEVKVYLCCENAFVFSLCNGD